MAKFIRILFILGHCLPTKFHLLPSRPVRYSSLRMYLFTLYVLFSVLRIQSLYASVFLGKCFHFDIHLLTSLLSFREVKTSSLLNSSTSALISYLKSIFLAHSKKITHPQTKSQLHLDWICTVKLTTTCLLPYMHLLEKTHPKIRKCEAASILPEF
jgi:hypothetical protein